MQNRYVGDVGDFGKYGLLRALCLPDGNKDPALKLGVVWYLTSDETHNNDGRHIGYLEPTPENLLAFRACDPDLYDGLRKIVSTGNRNVSAVRRQLILPENTVYYERVLDLKGCTSRPLSISRLECRRVWVKGAVQATEDCDVVFVDPDNGIGSIAQNSSKLGAKHVLLEELLPYVERGQTLVVYHHLNRQATASAQIWTLMVKVSQTFGQDLVVSALRYRKGSPRVFILCVAAGHQHMFQMRLQQFSHRPWNQHFDIYLHS